MTYRVYLRDFEGRVSEKTLTADWAVANKAFADLVNRTDCDGRKLLAIVTVNNRALASHRFDRLPGDADYWRDKLDEVPWPSGRVGRPAEMEGGKRVQVYLDEKSLAAAARLGGGNVSDGIRRALQRFV